jgi:hypothetical protein
MMEYLISAAVGAVMLLLVEGMVWMRVCLGLSMKERTTDFTDIMRRAPYRLFWPPKIITAVIDVIMFAISASYYRNGGQDLLLGAICLALLTLFVALSFWEGVRAVRQFDVSN